MVRYVCMGGNPATAIGSGVRYDYLVGGRYQSGAPVSNRYGYLACSGTFSNFWLRFSAALGAAKTSTWALYVNGAITPLTVTISGASQTIAFDGVHRVHVNKGTPVCLYKTTDSGATYGYPFWTMDFVSDNPNEWPIMGGWSSNWDTVNERFTCLYGGQTPATGASGQLASRFVVPISGKMQNLYAAVNDAPGLAASGKSYKFTVYKNNVATALACTILETATSASDLTNSLSLVPGDTISFSTTPANTPTATFGYWGVSFISDNPGWWFLGHASGEARLDKTGTTQYQRLPGVGDSWNSTETNQINYSPPASVGQYSPRPFFMKNFYCALSDIAEDDTAGLGWTFTVRANGATPTNTLTCQIRNTATTGKDITNKLLIDPGKTFDIMETNNTPTYAQNLACGIGCWTQPDENLDLTKRIPHMDRGIGLKRHPRSRIY